MRSILKSHRRSDSSTSDYTSPPDYAYSKPAPHKQNGSPAAAPAPLTPPPNFTSSQPMSSPKKLLTPIKKMFGHHPRPTALASAADSLNSVISGDFEPPRTRRPIRKPRSMANLSGELVAPQVVCTASNPPRPHPPSLQHQLSAPIFATARQPQQVPAGPTLDPKNSVSASKVALPVLHFNTSTGSLATSEKNFNIAAVNRHACITGALTREQVDADDDSRDSDTSSQFSFEKDIRGGRNTSVKYYKTKPQPGASKKTYFNIDQDFEGEALEDYDFENNGMSDEDCEDDFPGGTSRYGDFLSDEDVSADFAQNSIDFEQEEDEPGEVGGLEKTHSLDPNHDYSYVGMGNGEGTPMNHEFSISPAKSPPHLSTLTRSILSPGYDENFFDSYLGSKSPGASSPIIESRPLPGLSFAGLPSLDTNFSDDVAEHEMFANGLGIALAPEEPAVNRRESIVNMMDILSKLEGSTADSQSFAAKGPDEEAALNATEQQLGGRSKQQKRQSVMDMMSTLSFLDKQLERKESGQLPKKTSLRHKKYSWSCVEDSQEKDSSMSGTEEFSADGPHTVLDDDVLAEINSIPPDYDFDNCDVVQSSKPEPQFFRSNSYNKKPQKAVQEVGYQGNKIETPNKTVTFYRSRSLNDPGSSSSPSRRCSSKSARSFCEDGKRHEFEPAEHNHRSVFVVKVDSTMGSGASSQKSFSLEPITETDSPHLR